MKKVAILLGLALGWAQTGYSADASRGESLSAPCAACHGADGNSAAPSFPKLAGQGEKYLVKQLKDIKASVPVILLTGHGSITEGMEGMKLGAADYLMKPLDINELIEKIDSEKVSS